MPIYEYECPKCGRFDALQKMSAPPLEVHDVCGSKVRKLMSASAFAFKGSGFYITDYGKDGKKKQEAPAAEKKGESTPGPAAAPKPDAPAPKPKGGE